MKILIIKISSAGDILHSTATINAIKNAYPEAQIDMIIDPQYLKIVKNLKIINNFYYYDEKKLLSYLKRYKIFRIFKFFKNIFKQIKSINKSKYDIVLDLQGIEKSLLYYLFIKANKKACKWSLPYKSLPENKTEHAVKVIYNVAKKLLPKLEFSHTKQIVNNEMLKKDFDLNQKYCLISPFTRWKTRNLPIIYYIQIANYIISKLNLDVYFIFGPDEKEIFNNIINTIKDKKDVKALDFFYKNISLHLSNEKYLHIKNEFLKNLEKFHFIGSYFNLQELPIVIANAELFFGGDSFNFHTSQSVGTKAIEIFGSTNPKRVGPLNTKIADIYHDIYDCSFCQLRKCPNKGEKYLQCLYNFNINKMSSIINKLI